MELNLFPQVFSLCDTSANCALHGIEKTSTNTAN